MSYTRYHSDLLPDASMSDSPPKYMESEAGGNFQSLFETKLNAELQKSTGRPVSPTYSIIPPTPGSPGYAQESALLRGLQVPSRSKHISSGFRYPSILDHSGVSKKDWTSFTQEIEKYAEMSASQWITILGGAAGTLAVGNLMIGFLGLVPAVIVGRKMRDHREKQNLKIAEQSGALKQCVERWNQDYFIARGLLIRVDLPGNSYDMDQMDLSTSKSFNRLSSSGASPIESYGEQSFRTTADSAKAKSKDEKHRRRAARRGRIVIIPMDPSTLSTPSLSETKESVSPGSSSLEGLGGGDKAYEEGVVKDPSEYGQEQLTIFRQSKERQRF